MKDGPQELLGKTINGVAIKRGKAGRQPASRLFLTFADGTCFEFCSSGAIVPCGGVDPGTLEEVRRYLGDMTETVFETFPRRGF